MGRLKVSQEHEYKVSGYTVIDHYQRLRGCTDSQCAKTLGMCERSYQNKKKDIDSFSVGDLRRLKQYLRIPLGELNEGIIGRSLCGDAV